VMDSQWIALDTSTFFLPIGQSSMQLCKTLLS
jgi:hypothetical protein